MTLFSFRPTQERWEFEDQKKIVFIALLRAAAARPARPLTGPPRLSGTA